MLGSLLLIALGCQAEEAAICQFELLEPNRIVSINWTGIALTSEDNGKTWSRSPSIWMRDSLKVSDSELWGLSYTVGDARLARSSDKGSTWSAVTLDSKHLLPEAFLGARNGAAVLVDQSGQVWQWQRVKELKADGSDWARVGVCNPDERASGGVLVDGVLYVGSWGRIWCSTDMGASWTAFTSGDAPFVEFASSGSTCWAATREGAIFRVDRGQQDWILVASIPKVFFVFSLAAADDGVLVAGDGPLAFVVRIHADGRIKPLAQPKGKQAYKVQVDRDGSAWVATDAGLFHQVGNGWDQAWPQK